jgi:hypothetical protein
MTGTSAHGELALARDRKRMRGEYARANALMDEHPGEHVRLAVLAEAAAQATAQAGEQAAAETERRSRYRNRWRMPGAIAATLVVGTFATLISLRGTHQQDVPEELRAAPPAQAVASDSTPGSADDATVRQKASRPAKLASIAPRRADASPAVGPPGAGNVGAVAAEPQSVATAAAPAAPAPASSASASPTTTAVIESAPDPLRARRAADAVVMQQRLGETAREASAANVRPESVASKALADQAAPAALAASESPKPWLERIRKLRLDGRDEEADKEVKKFRERFPHIEIPEAAPRKPDLGVGSPY